MGFKMKGAPYTSGGPKNMQNVLAGKDPAQLPAKRKGAKNYGQEAETQGPLAMDPNYNGEPGVQKEDFKQFSSKGPKATKEERVAKRATKKAARVARRKEKGGSRVGNALRTVGKTVNKVANSKVGKIAVGTYKTVKAAKSGNIKGALVEGKKVASELATKSNKSKGAKMHKKGHNEKIGPGGESKSKKTTVMTQKGGPSKPGKKPGTTMMERVGEKITKKKSNKSKTKKFDPTKKSLKY